MALKFIYKVMHKKYLEQIYIEIQNRHFLWKKISRISKEYSVDDIIQEAWVFACNEWKQGDFFEIDNEDHWKYLYGAMYKHFVEWSEKHSRYGIQIDQAYTNHNFDECTHPLLRELCADESNEPLAYLEKQESENQQLNIFSEKIRLLGFSKLAAFLSLSHSFNSSRMHTSLVMNMSYSWFYRCEKAFQTLYLNQLSIFDEMNPQIESEQLQTWRKFRVVLGKRQNMKIDLQLPLDF
ncbi:hypothetical protein [Acinetobacter ursingii]|uniref:hypothetical protein n=1 Tax=Acinetobacter ursingii TaxID=108980 RepID=UPI0021CD91A1|nr:hypothetical protein [Acinetobacter ursingii]MCU4483202.1 hypothetical protein [Acinetobacter ursingii]MCU4507522.1 hypothetical protein [Acinetobacter ursingii]MCU4571353.1 hypothetical protein [Acinetobacter ursingii]